jgi:hypothetical protein
MVPSVMFFTDPATGHRHGYYDGWDDDGLFNYVDATEACVPARPADRDQGAWPSGVGS